MKNSTPPQKKTRKRGKSLTLEEVAAVPLPKPLESLDGYEVAFLEYATHRQETMRSSAKWKTAAQVERFHRSLEKKHVDGFDVLDALDEATRNGYQGVFPKKPRQRGGFAAKNHQSGDVTQPWLRPARPPQPVLIDCRDAARSFIRRSRELARIQELGGGHAEVVAFLDWRVSDPALVLGALEEVAA